MRIAGRVGLVLVTGLLVANCAQQNVASRSRSKEIGAFPQSKYGTASPRVVADGQDVPKGGGRDLVGRPYSVAGKRYVPYEKPMGFSQVGMASWYGEAFHGRRTANGEIYDRHGISAAHPTMPLPAYARVTNTLNSRSIIVRVNDRGPYHGGRIMDLSQRTADALAFRHLGTARIKVEYLGRASLKGSDDGKLLATLRTDGAPASLPGATPVMVASADPVLPSRPVTANAADLDGGDAPRSASAFAPSAAPVAPAAPQVQPALQPATATAPREEPASGRPVTGVPMPPERPFDLATIPNAARPVSTAVPGLRGNVAADRAARPVVASLFYAPVAAPSVKFGKGDPFKGLTADRFAPLDLQARR